MSDKIVARLHDLARCLDGDGYLNSAREVREIAIEVECRERVYQAELNGLAAGFDLLPESACPYPEGSHEAKVWTRERNIAAQNQQDRARLSALEAENKRMREFQKKQLRLIELQDKLLVCYRVGKRPGAWLDEMEQLRAALAAGEDKQDGM